MTQIRVQELLDRANYILDTGFRLVGKVMIDSEAMETLLDRIHDALPEDIREAERLLKRKDEIQLEAQQRADRIIADAQNEAGRVLSESKLLRAVQVEAQKIREQVISDCEDIKRRALDEAETIRNQALDEASKIREGAEVYAEQVLNNLETDLTQIQQVVKNGQIYLTKHKQSYQASVNSVQDANPSNEQLQLDYAE